MKKFNLPLTTAISAAILATAGCSSDKEWQINNDTKLCVDQSGNRVTEDKCNNSGNPGFFPYRWYYISRGGYVPYYNYPATGGSYTPAAPAASCPAGAGIRPRRRSHARRLWQYRRR